MTPQKTKNPNFNNFFIFPAILILCVACTPAAIKKKEPAVSNHSLAEYSMLKKHLPLIERENDVIKQENTLLKKQIQDMETRINELNADLDDLHEKYTQEMTAAALQIQNLQQDIENNKKESSEKITALTSLNNDLEKKRSREVQALNDRIVKQKSAFDDERKQILQKNAESELKLSGRINDLNKTIEAKVVEVSSLKIALSEITTKLGEATARAEALRKARDESVAELESVKETNTKLANQIQVLSRDIPPPDKRPETRN